MILGTRTVTVKICKVKHQHYRTVQNTLQTTMKHARSQEILTEQNLSYKMAK